MSLYHHGMDTVAAALYLFHNTLSRNQTKILESSLAENVENVISALGMLHDIGKMTPGFEKTHQGEIHHFSHAVAGMNILEELSPLPVWFSAICGSHHGKCPNQGQTERRDLVFGEYGCDNQLRKQQKKYIDEIIEKFSIESLPVTIPLEAQILLCDILIRADWYVSDTRNFPLLKDLEENYPGDRVDKGLQRLSRIKSWKPKERVTRENFERIFGFEPNPLQLNVLDLNTSHSGLYILEAETGTGKTEAALALATNLTYDLGMSGLAFGLPTMASSNGLFPRLKSYAKEESNELSSIILSHGKANLNSDWTELINNKDPLLQKDDWLSRNKLKLYNNFVFGTVDSLLVSALLTKHFPLRVGGITGKTVIIDEVHSYNSWMNTLIVRILEILGDFSVPVVLLSATLPTQKREALIQAYKYGSQRKSRMRPVKLSNITDYPAITWTDGYQVEIVPVRQSDRDQNPKITLDLHDSFSDEDILRIGEKHGATGIIVNTVSRAQEVYDQVKTLLPEKNILLFHSRFTAEDRARIEREVLRKISKDSKPETRRDFILISTQVLEQSLDIDFDELWTDLAPIDALVQRIGRLWRHQKNDAFRDNYQSPICHIIHGNIDDSYLIRHHWPYEEEIQKQTQIVLQSIRNLEGNFRKLLDFVYSENEPSPSGLPLLPRPWTQETLLSLNLNDCLSEGEARANIRGDKMPLEALLLMKKDDEICFVDGSAIEMDRLNSQHFQLPEDLETICLPLSELEMDLGDYDSVLVLNKYRTVETEKNIYEYSPEFGLKKLRKTKS